MKSYAFLFWAYNVIWIGLVTYMFYLIARLRRVDRRLSSLENALGRAAAADQESSNS